MRKIYLCGDDWCRPCQAVRKRLLDAVELDCPGQTEYVEISAHPGAINRFHVYRLPMMCLMDDDAIVERYSGKYPDAECLIAWLKGERDDLDTELH